MNAAEFIAKWKRVELKERSAAQEHFLDLCHLVGHKTPAEADPKGEKFCFEKGAAKHGGGDGFADVWYKDHFGWEYKGKKKDLAAAYNQLLLYRDALENPPLLVVCDLDRIIVHTNFTNTASEVHEIALDALGEPRNLDILRALFADPEKLRPGKTTATITQNAAKHFAGIADSMRRRGLDAAQVAHFLDRVVFCLFAEDIGLLPDMIFTKIAERAAGDPAKFRRLLGQLFEAMASGGDFGLESIRHFNGNLFDDATALDLTEDEAARIAAAASLDWSVIDPTIFGTLFERGLDPAKRSQLGAHFTGREDIELLVEAVVMQPLRREWDETRRFVEPLLEKTQKTAPKQARSVLQQFLTRLQTVKVLDPACGSGNFLYVTLHKLKDLEKEVIVYQMEHGLDTSLPMVGPWQLYGIEVNPYAHDLAQMTVWIGWLQWPRLNGFGSIENEPILRKIGDNFQCKDAILDLTDPAGPKEPDWPAVDFIVGNPPFLGTKKLRSELGDEYVDKLFALYGGRIPNFSDLCCYWFEKGRAHIEHSKCKRAGLLATQGIRGGLNREVLKRIKETGDIFWAVSDKDWILDGATVHVSIIGFDAGGEKTRLLDGRVVSTINPNLTSVADITTAQRLRQNRQLGFIADVKSGAFDIPEETAQEMKGNPNPHGRPNSDVVVPWVNGLDVLRRPRDYWIVDFGSDTTKEDASRYEFPFAHVEKHVFPLRAKVKRKSYRDYWWIHAEPCDEMRRLLKPLDRFIVTPTVSKHRVFAWLQAPTLPDHQLVAFVRSDDYFFGVLHSRAHEVWALAQGTQLREKESGFRYTPTSCFETFPLPTPTKEQEQAIAEAAKSLDQLRTNWLNPPEWTKEEVLEFPGTVGGPWDRFIDPATAQDRGGFKVGTVRYPRIVPRDEACAKQLQKRTLTNLYNQRPAWLDLAHKKLDEAVFAAYGWQPTLSDEEILERLLALNLERAKQN
ncbi:MAG TPA: N-6 DNA methylase [bacterium]|nr:N-6 DNA methylase [bacterium]